MRGDHAVNTPTLCDTSETSLVAGSTMQSLANFLARILSRELVEAGGATHPEMLPAPWTSGHELDHGSGGHEAHKYAPVECERHPGLLLTTTVDKKSRSRVVRPAIASPLLADCLGARKVVRILRSPLQVARIMKELSNLPRARRLSPRGRGSWTGTSSPRSPA